ncbi:hypothetical protein SAMN05660860_00736 [Geoalkalibacter ferrihydriticus]|uniref:Uncharacterized protein n=2 Tax=Geoalkalibacter ferrihydriticus TaxID=392333 RepID=A0A0C2EE27_9BACT|nr:hypothetical protein [Geoalkalibacter ferrihydriticus]KIH76848.1 hypothetical protein GFER_07005 [Geoalkalibacter ferrihydriticus DSM 17813]SDL47905.1 hypothetical protein SAMN05660860_00736 [Geoalkalibacter ferrihydriticus]
MTDRFTKAVEELQEKSPFICVSCGRHEIVQGREKGSPTPDEGVKDRFSEAVEESGQKSAFLCESCRKH